MRAAGPRRLSCPWQSRCGRLPLPTRFHRGPCFSLLHALSCYGIRNPAPRFVFFFKDGKPVIWPNALVFTGGETEAQRELSEVCFRESWPQLLLSRVWVSDAALGSQYQHPLVLPLACAVSPSLCGTCHA